jgi:hypothetical protein
MQQTRDRLNRPNHYLLLLVLVLDTPFVFLVVIFLPLIVFPFLGALLAVPLGKRSDVALEMRLYRISCLCLLRCLFRACDKCFLYVYPVVGAVEKCYVLCSKSTSLVEECGGCR